MKSIQSNRIIFILSLISLFIISCSPTKSYYFYSELSITDENIIRKEDGLSEQKGMLFDIAYYFMGQDLTMGIIIKNNLSESIIINWDKSTLKVNDLSEKVVSNIPGLNLNKTSLVILPDSVVRFDILKSAHFDIKSLNNKQLEPQNIYVEDKKIKSKSINFSKNVSPLILKSNIYIDINGKDTILSNTFYISKISSINKKVYNRFKSNSFECKDGFYSSYKIDRGKENKLLDGIFEQLIRTSINSIGTGEVRNHPKKYDEDTFYVPNR